MKVVLRVAEKARPGKVSKKTRPQRKAAQVERGARKAVLLGVRGGAQAVQVETLVSSSWLSAGTRGRKQPLANHLARGGLESEEEAYQPALSLLGHRRAQPPQRVERLRDVDSPRAGHRRVPSLGKNRNRMA